MDSATFRSFDIFDTLVARRCVYPNNIFRLVEAKAGHPGFAEMRSSAEASIYNKGEYGIDDIYRALISDFGLSEVAASFLKNFELAEEFENLIPIEIHISEVQPGDLLISDMYLPRWFITRVVREKCGLQFNPIFLSSHGKSSGRAWKVLTEALHIVEHTGNSEHSDVAMPSSFQVSSRHTSVWQMTPGETLVEELGYRELAQSVRAARLSLWTADSGKQQLGCAQIDVNFPLLYLMALHLINSAARKGWRRLLFSSRDCYLLFLLFQKLAGRLSLSIESEYFFTSRVARAAPSAQYLRYFNSLCGDDRSAVVDLCGTGWSLTRLFEIAARPKTEMYLMHKLNIPDLLARYREIGDIREEPNPTFLTVSGNAAILEALNSTDHPMVVDVFEVDGVFLPMFIKTPNPERYTELVRFSYKAFTHAIQAAEKISTSEIVRWLSIVRKEHIERIYHESMGGLSNVIGEISALQLSESGPAEAMIRARLASATR